MKFNADEIASVLEAEIRDFRGQVESADVGRVLEVGDGIARVHGLSGQVVSLGLLVITSFLLGHLGC